MGYMRHHAIIVSAYDETIEVAHARASAIFGELVTPIVESRVNSVRAFLVGPDGSKEHWDESDQGDRHRAEFVAWLRTQRDPQDSQLSIGSRCNTPARTTTIRGSSLRA